GSSYKFFLSILALIVVGIVLLISTASHRIGRIQSWWSTIQDTVLDLAPSFIEDWLRIPVEVIPYQIGHSINAIYNGALFGEGVGNGTFKLGFLSEVHTDFILSGLMEEFGFIGIFIVVSLFLVVLLRIFKVASRTEDTTVYLFTLGMGLILSIAFLVNAYGISGITPIKGISVPFLSYGGSSILGSSIAVGMVLMASKKVNMK
ncbi:MAG: FtsW/RodA/SpoVE family cell cycle protein, partial [Campylobacterota bacterium]|nr:FtsW/RodA/SpoVE family cell cycle protein [Campylobacterota bacterium]